MKKKILAISIGATIIGVVAVIFRLIKNRLDDIDREYDVDSILPGEEYYDDDYYSMPYSNNCSYTINLGK